MRLTVLVLAGLSLLVRCSDLDSVAEQLPTTASASAVVDESALVVEPIPNTNIPRRLFDFSVSEGTPKDNVMAFCRQYLSDLIELDEREERDLSVSMEEYLKNRSDRLLAAKSPSRFASQLQVSKEFGRILSVLKDVGRFPMNRRVVEMLNSTTDKSLKAMYLSTHYVGQVNKVFKLLEDTFGANSFDQEYRQFVRRIFLNGLMSVEAVSGLMERFFVKDLDMINAFLLEQVKDVQCPQLSDDLLESLPASIAHVLKESSQARALFVALLSGSFNVYLHSLSDLPITVNTVEDDVLEIERSFDCIEITVGDKMSKESASRCLKGLRMVEFEGPIYRAIGF